ncbi:hypothetical protein GWO43_21055 [candidate division KSB1 bacterium]|nr:hypothetical protein [candidate division KSB1 bacterium]NIR70284.1 hypothetical protein [candidate division KSB1 bacterium]NIS26554.1 hypothetical protein [candidate division KSB1 bacterium]NIT73317.1 hypothetical protein [candidate division KSB1 bacterium]NIU23940.1 hypothetical protein [candidate division KSB1 bacterium]
MTAKDLSLSTLLIVLVLALFIVELFQIDGMFLEIMIKIAILITIIFALPNPIDKLKFFITPFHTGTVNLILHAVSAVPLFVGLVIKDIPLIILFYIIESSGHVFNFVFKSDFELRENTTGIIPLQIALPGAFVLILMRLFGWF